MIKQTFTGIGWALLEPKTENVCLVDIVKHLGGINRYNGATKTPVSVLWHSLLVHHLADDSVKPWALLHDVHEAYLGDMTTPVKKAISAYCPAFYDAWQDLVVDHDAAIFAAFGLGQPAPADWHEIHHADQLALAYEREHYMTKSSCDWGSMPDAPEVDAYISLLSQSLFDGSDCGEKFIEIARECCPKLPPLLPHGLAGSVNAKGEVCFG